MFHPWQQTGFAAHRLSPDLPLLQQVEQSPRAEEYFDLDVFANMSEFGDEANSVTSSETVAVEPESDVKQTSPLWRD